MHGRTIPVIVLVAFDTSPVTLAPLMPQVLALLPTIQPGKVYTVEALAGNEEETQQQG